MSEALLKLDDLFLYCFVILTMYIVLVLFLLCLFGPCEKPTGWDHVTQLKYFQNKKVKKIKKIKI